MRLTTTLIGAWVFAAAMTTGAQAAPQLLGVIASAAPLKLHCDGAICRTEITTFCLQAERETPARDHPYTANSTDVFSVVTRTESGETVRVPLASAKFRSVRGYTATQVVFDGSTFAARGLTPVALHVGQGGILVPKAVAGDPDPIRESEIDFALASLNPKADEVFKKHGKDYEAIRLVGRLLNETPERGRLAKSDRDSLWQDTFGESPRESVGEGAHRAADVLGYCQYRSKQGRFFSVRRCLEQRLDGMLMDINAEYWKAVQPVS